MDFTFGLRRMFNPAAARQQQLQGQEDQIVSGQQATPTGQPAPQAQGLQGQPVQPAMTPEEQDAQERAAYQARLQRALQDLQNR